MENGWKMGDGKWSLSSSEARSLVD
jgi:hypothetical protein